VVFFGDNGQAHVRGSSSATRRGSTSPPHLLAEGLPGPGGAPAGIDDDRLISMIDLGPTLLALAGGGKPPGMDGRVFLGDLADPPRRYAFGARDRCDETVFRLRTVRDYRYRYIRNFTPERPFLQANEYKEKSYPVWNLLRSCTPRGSCRPSRRSSAPPRCPPRSSTTSGGSPRDRQPRRVPAHREVLAACSRPSRAGSRRRGTGGGTWSLRISRRGRA